MHAARKSLLLAEFLLLYGMTPWLMTFVRERGLKFAVLGALCFFAMYMLHRERGFSVKQEWNWPAVRPHLRQVLRKMVPAFIGLTLLLLLLRPERLLSFPLERPGMWLLVMLLYPLVSVIPQEVIFRSFYHHRYAVMFPHRMQKLLAAGIIFGWAHIMFMNPVAVLLCFAGGVIFSHHYMQHRSLALVSIEHALYGCFIFTIGLGQYFYGMSFKG